MDPAFINSSLSKRGIEECELASFKADEIMTHLSMILVSPLKRNYQTAYEIFKHHPNFSKVKVMVVPDLREVLESPCDVPVPVDEIVKDLKKYFSDE